LLAAVFGRRRKVAEGSLVTHHLAEDSQHSPVYPEIVLFNLVLAVAIPLQLDHADEMAGAQHNVAFLSRSAAAALFADVENARVQFAGGVEAVQKGSVPAWPWNDPFDDDYLQ
jgi:hypothetical protein